MVEQRPIYKKTFSRDFTLVSIEIWWRGEVRNDKIWTEKHQPFLPYIVFEREGDIVHCYYDPRGINWIKDLLLDRIKKDDTFLPFLEKNYLDAFSSVRDFYNNKDELSHGDLCKFIVVYEKGYVWLEAAWWLWDMTQKELNGVVLPEHFKKLREESQDYVPKSENLIRKSLAKIYPKLADYIEVLRVNEIEGNKIPNISELIERKRNYFFIRDRIFTGLSRTDVEKKFKIKFETVDTKGVIEIRGVPVYGGKVSGRAKIIWNVKNITKVDTGDILVSPMTLPDLLPAIKKCVAIVTDEGGMLSHAAIISRELRKPCIIGTKIATKVLKDGDLVEVDAERGIVTIIKRRT